MVQVFRVFGVFRCLSVWGSGFGAPTAKAMGPAIGGRAHRLSAVHPHPLHPPNLVLGFRVLVPQPP